MRTLPYYHVTIDPDGIPASQEADYEDLVELDLGKLYGTVTGRAIFRIIAAHGHVLIQPYTGGEKCQAQSTGGYGNVMVRTNTIQVVEFSPGDYAKGHASGCSVSMTWNSDELLCHEIFHAARRLGGDTSYFDGLKGYMEDWENEEEFFAILVANVYSSETNRPHHLRVNHGKALLQKGFWDPEKWLSYKEAHYVLVAEFCAQHDVAAPMMAKASATFNPIRTYYEWQRRNFKPAQWDVKTYEGWR